MNKEAKKILITGGTGFIGCHLCDRLIKDGYILYVLTRNRKLNNAQNSRTKFYIYNLSEIENIDIDIVINLAGETIAQRWTKASKERIYNSRIATTQNLVNFIRSKSKKPSLFISGSAVGYYGTDADKIFTEENLTENIRLLRKVASDRKIKGDEARRDEVYKGVHEGSSTESTHNLPAEVEFSKKSINSGFATSLCKDWEDQALYANELGIRTVTLRIGPVLEKDGGMLAKLLPSFRIGLGSQIGDGNQWLSWIDRDDLIELIIFIINKENINGPVNATAPNPVKNREFSLALSNALNRPCFLKTPEFIFKLIFGQMAEEIMINGQKVLPEKAISNGFQFSYPTIAQSLSKILRS